LKLLASVPAVAVFDTAFHATIPDVAARYAIPNDLASGMRCGDTASTASHTNSSLDGCCNASA
jgi:hypothetical protein